MKYTISIEMTVKERKETPDDIPIIDKETSEVIKAFWKKRMPMLGRY